MSDIGVVVIGRNEGDRLKACIASLSESDLKIVYVDSNSSDDSVAYVKSQGFDVLELDMSIPFSAARARNEGYTYLLSKYTGLDYIQFVDGDCEFSQGWVEAAYEHLKAHPQLASVCGRRKERFPDKTPYNKLCDIEWNTPVGFAKSTGGDFMCRAQALVDVNGFNPAVIAGEEPELCFRIRQQGWKIERLDLDMTLHDADMHTLSQWWRRNERSGHAYAHVAHLHFSSEEKMYQRNVLSIIIWGGILPAALMLSVLAFPVLALLIVALYAYLTHKVYKFSLRHSGLTPRDSFLYAIATVAGKIPNMCGIVRYMYRRLFSKQSFTIIEYK